MDKLTTAAVGAVERGCSVIPARADKRPLVEWARYQSERASLDQILEWAQDLRPDAWGIVTGAISGVVVLDFDGEAGRATLERLGLLPHIRTGSGGFHVYVEHPGAPVKTVSGKAAKALAHAFPGLDVRADGGYAIFAGQNERGEYVELRPPENTPISEVPDDVSERVGLVKPPTSCSMAPRSAVPAVARGVGDEVDLEFVARLAFRYLGEAPTVGRNQALLDFLCQLRDDGCPLAVAQRATRAFVEHAPAQNPSGVDEPFTLAEALRTLKSVYARPPREPWPSRATVGLPTVQVNNRQLRDLSDEILGALTGSADSLRLFRRGNCLVQIRTDDEGRSFVEVLDRIQLRRLATDVADFFTAEGEEEEVRLVHVSPPMNAIDGVIASGHWPGVPLLVGITEAPVVRQDASILTEPGYDRRTRLVYEPSDTLVVPRIPDQPSPDQVTEAREALEDLLSEFAFDSLASKANAFALLVTVVVRTLIDGLVPLALVTAPQAGTGKTLLVKLIGLLATGRSTPAMAWPRSEEEVEKRITAKLLAGHPMLLIDNLHDGRSIVSPSLDALLTTDVFEGRLLGRSKMLQLPHKLVVAATGNNLTIAGDLHRRSFPIRLDARVAHPESREFRRPEPETYLRDHRGELLAAVFTLVRAWDVAGRPGAPSGVRLASYQAWVDTVGGILGVAGIDGFLGNRGDVLSLVDDETAEWAVFLDVLRAKTGGAARTVAELRHLITFDTEVGAVVPRGLAESLAGAHSDNSAGGRLGKQMARRRARRFAENGLRVEDAGNDPATKAKRWRVITDDD